MDKKIFNFSKISNNSSCNSYQFTTSNGLSVVCAGSSSSSSSSSCACCSCSSSTCSSAANANLTKENE